MKFFKNSFSIFLILINLIYVSRTFEIYKNDVKSFSNSLNVIVEKFYLKNNLEFQFIIGDVKCEKFASQIIKNILKVNPQIPVEVTKIDDLEGYRRKYTWLRLKKSAIIFIHHKDSTLKLNEIISTNSRNDYVRFQHLVVIQQQKPEKVKKFVNLPDYGNMNFFSTPVNYMVFMYKDGRQLKLETIKRFTKKDCGISLVKINEFSITNQEWKNDNFSLIETKNFNGCKICLRLILDSNSTESMYHTNLMRRIFKEMSGKFNFNFVNCATNGSFEEDKNNFIGNARMNNDSKKYERIIDSSMSGFTDKKLNKLKFEIKLTLMDFAVIVPLGKQHTAYEKFILPFELYTWICCGLTFGSAFAIIIIINATGNRNIQNFVYGHRVTNPAFNILCAFFGQSQNILPRRNFARFMLMMLIILCFIVRTLYQGVQFDMTYMVSEIHINEKHNLIFCLSRICVNFHLISLTTLWKKLKDLMF